MLVPKTLLLELGLVGGLVDLLEVVLPDTIVALENGVLSRPGKKQTGESRSATAQGTTRTNM